MTTLPSPGSRLRQLMAADDIVVAPGAYDGLSARLVQRAGFKAVYASGGAISRSRAVPDLGLLSAKEVVDTLQSIVEAVNIPVIADADTGYGNALNVARTVRDFERCGVAGFHLEDQEFPKKCGHYADKAVIPAAEMQQKIRAACDARRDANLVIVGRTDALAIEGLSSAIERAEAYAEAGADVLFVEAPTTEAQIEEIARRVKRPLLINMFKGGKTPLLPAARLRELGYRIVIIPSDLQRAAIGAMQRTLEQIAQAGHSGAMDAEMVTFAGREEIVGTADYQRLEALYKV